MVDLQRFLIVGVPEIGCMMSLNDNAAYPVAIKRADAIPFETTALLTLAHPLNGGRTITLSSQALHGLYAKGGIPPQRVRATSLKVQGPNECDSMAAGKGANSSWLRLRRLA
jgi:hypothetical protein